MKLRKLLAGVPLTEEEFDGGLEISSLSYDSRTLEPGALFVALPGAKTDGSRFIDQAMERGAAAVLMLCLFYAGGVQPKIASVVDGAPAQMAELQAGDVVTAVNGTEIAFDDTGDAVSI